jgi:branched-subunit amino acid aminotransferase/4-amino-4-deoxychorismate lyase
LPPAWLVTVSIRRNPTAPSARFKTISYFDQVAALAEAKEAGGDEALMLGPSGQLACASAANLWVCRRGEWTTPRVEDGAMPGVTRRSAIRSGLSETTLMPGDLLKCDAAALTNAVIGMRGIASVDGTPIPQDPAALDTLRDAIRYNPGP